jgi:hypothetical protein
MTLTRPFLNLAAPLVFVAAVSIRVITTIDP